MALVQAVSAVFGVSFSKQLRGLTNSVTRLVNICLCCRYSSLLRRSKSSCECRSLWCITCLHLAWPPSVGSQKHMCTGIWRCYDCWLWYCRVQLFVGIELQFYVYYVQVQLGRSGQTWGHPTTGRHSLMFFLVHPLFEYLYHPQVIILGADNVLTTTLQGWNRQWMPADIHNSGFERDWSALLLAGVLGMTNLLEPAQRSKRPWKTGCVHCNIVSNCCSWSYRVLGTSNVCQTKHSISNFFFIELHSGKLATEYPRRFLLTTFFSHVVLFVNKSQLNCVAQLYIEQALIGCDQNVRRMLMNSATLNPNPKPYLIR